MPFANLPAHEKDAFFALLDEYFTSRPDLLSRVGSAGGPEIQPTAPQAAAAATAMTTAAHRALANPATSRMLAAGFQRAASSPANTGTGTGTSGAGGSGNNTAAASHVVAALPSLVSHSRGATDNNANAPSPSPGVSVGRVAAAAQAFSGAAPPPPRGNPPAAAASAPHKRTDSGGGLVPQKKFGDVDVSSAGAMFRSLRGSTAAKNAPPPTVYTPPAFAGKKASSAFAPPPVRRVSASSPPAAAAHVPEPEEDAQPEYGEEEAGEWAQALYDYTGQEAGDLHLQVGDRVRVTEQTSSDWWTGEVDGRSGLFPATYVKLL